MPGILNLLIEGCLEWQRRGLAPPARVLATTEDYFLEQDGVAQFVAECCIVGEHLSAPWRLLMQDYTRWAKERNESPLGARRFGVELKRLGFVADVSGKDNIAVRTGLALASQVRVEAGDVDLDGMLDEADDSISDAVGAM